MQFSERRIHQHSMSGFSNQAYTQSKYEDFWARVKKTVPAGRRLHFDMKKHGHRDLCKFLSVSGKSMCENKGPLPYKKVGSLSHEGENPLSLAVVVVYLVFLHFVS